MRAKSWMAVAAVMFGMLACALPAGAAVSYSYSTNQADFSAVTGQQIPVKLYLLETLTGGSQSLINTDGGMLGVGVKVSRASGAATLTGVALNTTDFGGPTNQEISPTTVRLTEAIAAAPGTPGVMTGNSGGDPANTIVNAVYLGTVTVTGGNSAFTTFNLLPYDNLGGNTLTLNNFRDLDFGSSSPAYTGTTSSPTTFSVTNPSLEPEPTSAAMILLFGGAGVLRRHRRVFSNSSATGR